MNLQILFTPVKEFLKCFHYSSKHFLQPQGSLEKPLPLNIYLTHWTWILLFIYWMENIEWNWPLLSLSLNKSEKLPQSRSIIIKNSNNSLISLIAYIFFFSSDSHENTFWFLEQKAFQDCVQPCEAMFIVCRVSLF